ncbi:MAG: BlaI/MecI/CopY family transcriptional regulator [Candidatus Gastranaerophilales bacterium]|nr:BlaI/MecI/CopY family transcriptional regulator [Candidatus Gastranaerophilales bacterium]
MESEIMVYGILEIEIMNVIWKLQKLDEDANISVSDIVNELNDNQITRAYTTIKTVMDRLVTKGILARYRNNKKFFYRSTLDKTEAAKKVLEAVGEQFFDGDPINMLRFIEKECEYLLV